MERRPMDVAEMVEEELRAAREKQETGAPSSSVFDRDLEIEIEEEPLVDISSTPPTHRIKEEFAAKYDPRREEDDMPPPTARGFDPLGASTKPPPPNYAPELDWDFDE